MADPEEHPADRIEGDAPAMAALRGHIRRLAAFDVVGAAMVPTVLLSGETGTGKGLVARVIHDSGPRARGPFVPVNCAAIPETMLEAELFGHEPGAFTDARRAKPGLFEAAAGGTLFLDEIDSLTVVLQSKLLTAIESKRIRRLGAVEERLVDVKLLAATQRDLPELAAAGKFREDLYHRLAVVVLELPALRDRGGDILALARSLLERFGAGYGARPKRLSPDADAWLLRQRWPGNVRELGHLMERVTLLHPEAMVDARGLARLAGPEVGAPQVPSRALDASSERESAEVGELRRAIERAGGNVAGAARLLGVSRDAVRYRMRQHGIRRPDLDAPAAGAPAPDTEGDAGARAREMRSSAPSLAEPASVTPAWERKPVALVAVSLAWRGPDDGAMRSHEPWTEHQRWAALIREKLSGLGGVTLEDSPALFLWAFGVPQAIEQPVERAVHGALAVRLLGAGIAGRELGPEIRVAVHRGSMVVDTVAPEPARTAVPVGETAALPVRLLGEARAGDVVASGEVADHVAGWARVEPFEPRGSALAGRPAFRIEGLRPWRTRGSSRPLTPFVGRARELATLESLMEAAEAGAGQVVGIVGAPGSGKSRLLRELRRRLEGRGVVVNEAHALAHGAMAPLLPFIEMARSHFDVTESDSLETVREHVRVGLEEIGLDAEADGPYLIALLRGERPERVDGETLKHRILGLIRRIAIAFCEKSPLLLTIENAHWLDPTSEACVADLAEHLARARCLLVMTYRPGYRPGWLHHSYATQIALAPLGTVESRRIVDAVAGDHRLPPALAEEVLSRAEGNPLFLEELTRAVLDHGPTAGVTIPETVQAVIAVRIDRLAAEDRRLLQAAAVVGREASQAALELVADLGEPALRAGLAHLEAAELLFRRGARAEPTYGFKHALIHDVAYESLPGPSRAALHARAADALERLDAAERPEMLSVVARHAALGGDVPRAIDGFHRAGLAAMARDAYQEAVRALDEALTSLARLPGGADVDRQGCDVRFELAEALYRGGDLARVIRVANEALTLAEQLGDRPRSAYALGMLAHWLTNEGRYAEAIEAGERGLGVALPLGLTMIEVWTRIVLGRTCLALGQYPRAAAYLRAALGSIGEDGDQRYALRGLVPPSPQARSYLALSLIRTGELDEARVLAEQARETAEQLGGPTDHAWTSYVLGRVHHARTDWDRALPLLERAVKEGEVIAAYLPRLISGLASAFAQSGRVDEALPLLERALALAAEMKFEYGHTLIVCQLGTTCVDAGRLDEAFAHATRALDAARRRGERGEEAWALLLLGDVAARREAPDVLDARTWYERALALAVELGMRPLAVRARLGLGAVERRAGRRDEARQHLAVALAEARAMGIAAWETRAVELSA